MSFSAAQFAFSNGGALQVTSSSVAVVSTPITGLGGMTGLTARLDFRYGSSGTKIQAYLQSGFDESTYYDIACMSALLASKSALLNFSGLTPKLTEVTPTDGALADDTAIDGLLGDRLRLKVVITGTYAGSSLLSGYIAPR